jgi:uncharacterized membrane protein
MKWLLVVLTVLCAPTLAFAQTLPALFSVSGIEEDGILNIHAEPSSFSQAVESYAWDARDIEIVALDDSGEWGQININETTAWVPMKNMEEQFSAGNTLLPRPLVCFGNEPFWTLDLGNNPFAELGWLDGVTLRFSGLYTISSESRTGRYMMLAENTGRSLHAFVERKSCNDGMSDRAYGLDMNLLIRDGDKTMYFAGCCSISPS